MNVAMKNQEEVGYRLAEQKAEQYLATLIKQVRDRTYVSVLTEAIRQWKPRHLSPFPWQALLARKRRSSQGGEDRQYIRWLQATGKLDAYLDRSISYIYMRDLGHALDSPDTQRKIAQMSVDVKKYLLRATEAPEGEAMSPARVYRWGQQEGVESAVIWVMEKLRHVSAHIPKQMNAEHAERKLIKIIVGVVLHVLDELDGKGSPAERARRLDEAIRLGYAYGITYPFIDDLLDSPVLSEREKAQYSRMIHLSLQTGVVPELDGSYGEREPFIRFVHKELREAFHYMNGLQHPDRRKQFLEQAYIFFHAQHIDRVKELSTASYTNEELYVPVIIKSSSSRLIVRSVLRSQRYDGFEDRTFHYGIYNQLADDFADLYDDLEQGAVTPYTYYLTYRDRRPDLINPFELYWAVISHLIHTVYRDDPRAREVILDRAINGLKRCRSRLGGEKYKELMGVLATSAPSFDKLIQRLVRRAEDVDFYDKRMRDQIAQSLRNDRREQEVFLDTLRSVQKQMNETLHITQADAMPSMKVSLIEAANYTIEGGGKRLRPILAWFMGVREYGLDASAIAPLLRSLEYMHTASLIFDDLPSQDDAPTRRGRPTLHEVHDSATAELTGLYLIQKAIQEQTSLRGFPEQTVLALIRYSAEKAEDLCAGQAMDLQARGKALTLEEMNQICYYKTGVAFEASLVMPAILAQANSAELGALKTFSYHAGIAFQIKDDLLDAEGDAQQLGKPVGQDEANGSSTFVSVLGAEGAKKQLWEHYCMAMEALVGWPSRTAFLKQVLSYMVNRDR